MSHPGSPAAGGRRARIASVAVGYLGFSWLVLQVVDVIRDIVPLPAWLAPGALIVLGVGFLFVLATAWIQADPDITRREQAGELPGDWQVAPKEAIDTLLRGQLPHLTWGRTITAGGVALSVLFGLAGAYVLVSRRAAAPRAWTDGAVRVATMPFTTTGADLDVYQEGMVELLATNLDGLGDIRAIASRTVLARWDELAGGTRPDLDAVLAMALATGATHALIGSIVAAGADVRLTAQLFDLDSGADWPIPSAEGPAESILSLVDGLSVSVVRALLGSEDSVVGSGSRLASLTTSSLPALRLYLEAESLYRRASFAEAIPLLDRAVEADPTFGLAVMRRAQAFGWLPGAVPADTVTAARRAIAPLLGGMSKRDATLAEAGIVDFADRDALGVRMLRDFVVRYPDEAEGHFQLADFIFHLNGIRGGTQDEVLVGFDRAVDLAPRFAPYYIHALDGALFRGDSARTRVLLDQYRALAGEDQRWTQARLAFRLLFHPDSLSAAEITLAPSVFTGTLVFLVAMSEQPQLIADVTEQHLGPDDLRRITASLRAGRWRAVRETSASFPSATRDQIMQKALLWTGAFGLERTQTSLIANEAAPTTGPDFWVSDAASAVGAMLDARDNGTGADPVVLAHLAHRAGNMELAESLFLEESWREYGPAMLYRLAKLYETTNRPAEAGAAYERFLNLWSTADPELPPVRDARAALLRIRR